MHFSCLPYLTVAVQQKRRAKLIARQLDALRWLEELVALPPDADDLIASWISPDLARHLQAVGLFTLRQLITHILAQEPCGNLFVVFGYLPVSSVHFIEVLPHRRSL